MQTNEEVTVIEASEDNEPTIIQIMHALPGWEAVWSNLKSLEKGQSGYRKETVVCWALLETSDSSRYVLLYYRT